MAMHLLLPVCLCIAAADLQLDEAFYGDPSRVLESAQQRGSDLTIEEAQEISNFVKQYGLGAFQNLSLASGVSFDWDKFAGGISSTKAKAEFKAWDAGFGLIGGGIKLINDLSNEKPWTTVVFDVGRMALPFLTPVLAGINPLLAAAFSLGVAVLGSLGGSTSDAFTNMIQQLHDEIMAETENFVTETFSERDIHALSLAVGGITDKLLTDDRWRCNESHRNAAMVRRSCEDNKYNFADDLNRKFEYFLSNGHVFSLSCTQFDSEKNRVVPVPLSDRKDEVCAKFQGDPWVFRNQSVWVGLYLQNLIDLYRFDPTRVTDPKQMVVEKAIELQELLLDSAIGFAFQHDRISGRKWPDPWYEENTFHHMCWNWGYYRCHRCFLIASEEDAPPNDPRFPSAADDERARYHFTAPVAGWSLLDNMSLVYGPNASCDWWNSDYHHDPVCPAAAKECQADDRKKPSTYKNGLGICCQEPFRQLHYFWQSRVFASLSTSVYQGMLTEGRLNLGSPSPSIPDQVLQPVGMSWVGSGTQLAVYCCNPHTKFCMTRATSPVYFSSVTPTTYASRIWSWNEQQHNLNFTVAMSAVPFKPWIAYVRRIPGIGGYGLELHDFDGNVVMGKTFVYARGVEVSPDGNFIALFFYLESSGDWTKILRSEDLSEMPKKDSPSNCTELDVSAFAWRKDSQGYAMYTRTNGFRWYNIDGSGENSTCVLVPTDTSELFEWQVNGLHFNSDGSVVALQRLAHSYNYHANGIYFMKFSFDETGRGAGKLLFAQIWNQLSVVISSADWGADGQGNPDGRLVTSATYRKGYGYAVTFWRLKSDYSEAHFVKQVLYESPVKQVALMSGAGAIVLLQNDPSNIQTGNCSVESLTPWQRDCGCRGVASQEGTWRNQNLIHNSFWFCPTQQSLLVVNLMYYTPEV